MSSPLNSQLLAAYRSASRMAGAVVPAVGFLVLAGWLFNIPALQSVVPGLATMKANTALCFILAGSSLWFLQNEVASPVKKRIGKILASLILLIGLLTLSQYLFKWELGIDQLLVKDLVTPANTFPGRMSEITALCFILIGLSLLLIDFGAAFQLPAGLVVVFSLLALFGYLFNVQALYRLSGYGSVALHTSITLLVVSLGVIAARPTRGVMNIIASDLPGSRIMRLLFPVTIVLIIILASLVERGRAFGIFELGNELVIFVIVFILVLLPIFYFNASTINQTEESFHTTFHANPVALAISRVSDGRILEINDAYTQTTGYRREEVIGRSALELNMYTDPNARSEVIRRLKEHGVLRNYEIAIRHPSGQVRYILTSIEPIKIHGEACFLSALYEITERKQAEERFYLAVESAPNAIVVVNQDGRISLVNAQTEKFFGYDRAELIGLNVDSLVPERFRGKHAKYREGFLVGLQARPIGMGRELYGLRKDGGEFPAEIGLTPIETREGLLVMATIVDITERKRAEEVLRQSEERFASVFRSSPTPITLTRLADGKTIDVNEAFCKLFGFTRQEAVGRTSLELGIVDPEARQKRVEQVKETGLIQSMEIKARNRNGQPLDLLISIEAIQLNREAFALTTMIDITERKRADERQEFLTSASKTLASSLDYETTLRTVAQLAVPKIADWCTVYLIAPDGSLEQVALTHADPEKVKWARELQQRYPPNPNAPRGVAQVIRSGQAEFMPEIPAELLEPLKQNPETSAILNELQLTGMMTVPLTLHDRTLGAISLVSAESRLRYTREDLELAEELARRVAVAVENARLYRAAQQLNQELEQRVIERTAQLETANKELEAFAYSVSHDLRAPLRGIDGFSHALLEDYGNQLPAEGISYLERVRSAAQRMAELIDDLLGLSRVTRASVDRVAVDLSALAEKIADELQHEQPERQVQFSITPGLSVEGDFNLLRIALTNLLNNAWKFTVKQKNPLIEFGMQEENGQRVFFVRDNGTGFDMTYAGKLFGAFQRLHSVSEFPGTGIGLATVQRIFHKHGGKVWAEGAVDQGATFYFTLDRSKNYE